MLRQMNIEWGRVKTYATEDALMKRINEDKDLYPDNNDRYLVVRTPEGRWTAIIQIDRGTGGYAGRHPFLKV